MAEYYAVCDTAFITISNGNVRCMSTLTVKEVPQTINDLSTSEIDTLAGAIVTLFVIAFIGRFLIRQFYTPPGRN